MTHIQMAAILSLVSMEKFHSGKKPIDQKLAMWLLPIEVAIRYMSRCGGVVIKYCMRERKRQSRQTALKHSKNYQQN
ncbi:hypothetical protein vBKpnSMK54_39 [Klebsiella phage vB_KpnS_MK54]|uniref:hypothetical protein n=1 Tax=Klebsiella phage vB_KpnS_MK54 TaxID=2783667 RepID=UPI001CE4F7A1|nr:hypothetical protein PRB83_gp39 [Klebsiella phage vB_KpnS_MK54]QZD26081.1 hypothetical protein vBKpnSMK54_39 [Klebsiella phage vB_KpnS_MK54]